MRYLTFLLLLSGLLALGACSSPDSGARLLPPDEFKSTLAATPNAYLIDVRTPEEFSAGHIPNALNINYKAPDFKEKISQLDPSRPVFVYCAGGNRSSKSCPILSEAGFQQIIDLKGGFNAYGAR